MNAGMSGFQSYILRTSPRSGSTLLCQLLAATGVAGHPKSYFHRPDVASWARGLELQADGAYESDAELNAVLRAAITAGRADTPLFGLRLQSHSCPFFFAQLARLYPDADNDAARIEHAFGRTAFVYLNRDDKVDQAVSYLKASQTGLWHKAPDGTEIERNAPPAAPVYDGDKLRALWEQMCGYDCTWNDWFAAQGIAPTRVSYDALSANPVPCLRTVLSAIGCDPDAAHNVTPGVAKLADAQSQAWADRLRAELAGDASGGVLPQNVERDDV